jgi:hypothetical protein
MLTGRVLDGVRKIRRESMLKVERPERLYPQRVPRNLAESAKEKPSRFSSRSLRYLFAIFVAKKFP